VSQATPVLSVQDLSAGGVGAEPVEGVDFTVGRGELLAIVGPNGAGKTTLVSALAGLVPLRTGSIRLRGVELSRLAVEARVWKGLAVVPEGWRLFVRLTVRENLAVAGWRAPGAERRALDLVPGLAALADLPVHRLDAGGRARCALGRALASDPAVIVVDEPTLGLAADQAEELAAIYPDVAALGISVVVAETDAARATRFAERLLLIERGRLVREGTPGELVGDPSFVESQAWQ